MIFCLRNVCRLLTWGGVSGSEMLSTSDACRHGDRLTRRDRFWLAISRFAGLMKPADEMTAHFHSTWDLSLSWWTSRLFRSHTRSALKSDWSEDGKKIDWKEETDRVKWDPAGIRSSTSGAWVITMETGPFPCALWGALCPWRPYCSFKTQQHEHRMRDYGCVHILLLHTAVHTSEQNFLSAENLRAKTFSFTLYLLEVNLR